MAVRNIIVGIPEDNGGEAIQISELGSGTTLSSTPVTGDQFLEGMNRETLRKQYDGKLRKFTYVSGTAGGLDQIGTVAFGAGVVSVAVVFPETFSAIPNLQVSLDVGAAAVQAAAFQNLTAAGFTFRRSAAAGATTGHWRALGQQV